MGFFFKSSRILSKFFCSASLMICLNSFSLALGSESDASSLCLTITFDSPLSNTSGTLIFFFPNMLPILSFSFRVHSHSTQLKNRLKFAPVTQVQPIMSQQRWNNQLKRQSGDRSSHFGGATYDWDAMLAFVPQKPAETFDSHYLWGQEGGKKAPNELSNLYKSALAT